MSRPAIEHPLLVQVEIPVVVQPVQDSSGEPLPSTVHANSVHVHWKPHRAPSTIEDSSMNRLDVALDVSLVSLCPTQQDSSVSPSTDCVTNMDWSGFATVELPSNRHFGVDDSGVGMGTHVIKVMNKPGTVIGMSTPFSLPLICRAPNKPYGFICGCGEIHVCGNCSPVPQSFLCNKCNVSQHVDCLPNPKTPSCQWPMCSGYVWKKEPLSVTARRACAFLRCLGLRPALAGAAPGCRALCQWQPSTSTAISKTPSAIGCGLWQLLQDSNLSMGVVFYENQRCSARLVSTRARMMSTPESVPETKWGRDFEGVAEPQPKRRRCNSSDCKNSSLDELQAHCRSRGVEASQQCVPDVVAALCSSDMFPVTPPQTVNTVQHVAACLISQQLHSSARHPRVLELGFGTGAITGHLATLPFCTVTGVECNDNQLRVAAKSLPDSINLIHADMFSEGFVEGQLGQQRYNLVVCNPTFSTGMAALALARLLVRPDGRLLFILPSNFFTSSRMRRLQYNILNITIEHEYCLGNLCYYPHDPRLQNKPKMTPDSLFVMRVEDQSRHSKHSHPKSFEFLNSS